MTGGRREAVSALLLSAVPGIGNLLFKRLIERFGSAEAVLAALSAGDLAAIGEVEGIGPKAIDHLAAVGPEQWKAAEEEARRAQEEGIALLPLSSDQYPSLLFQIPDPPPLLYIKGEEARQTLAAPAIAIVGSRDATPYGVSMAGRLAGELAARGVTIISGFARGIDAAAHRGALERGGRTVAVFGCGIDVIYPAGHRRLAEEVRARGALVSELPLSAEPSAEHFPARNRIISGLSLGVLVVEAAERSGSLITARLALDQGREVFAVPGQVGGKNSAGSNGLIKRGAKLVESVDDILEEVAGQVTLPNLSLPAPGSETPASPPGEILGTEGCLIRLLSEEPRHVEWLIAESGLAARNVTGALLQLEIKGAVRQMPGQYYVRR